MFDNLSGMTLGKKISYLRKQRGWTQQELADKISVHGRHVTRLEHDKMKPSPATLAQLSQVFQGEPDVLADAIAKSAVLEQIKYRIAGWSIEIASDDYWIVAAIHALHPQ